MPPSVASAEKGKPPGVGCCLLPRDGLPLRQPRRILNLVPHAGVISAPKASSGPAGSSYIFAPQGHLSPAGVHSASEHVSTGLALKIGSREASPLTSVAAPSVVVSSLAGAPGGHVVERVGSATASFLHLGRCPAKNAAQHVTQPFCPVAPSVFGSAHERNHEGVLRREVVNLCQGFGNVCRA